MASRQTQQNSAVQSNSADMQVEQTMGRLLQIGVILAAATVLAGGVMLLVKRGSEAVDLARFQGEPERFRNLAEIVEQAAALSGRGVIQLGLLLLVATPVARVVFSIYAFARQRDWMYVIFTLVVLGTLSYSLFFGGS